MAAIESQPWRMQDQTDLTRFTVVTFGNGVGDPTTGNMSVGDYQQLFGQFAPGAPFVPEGGPDEANQQIAQLLYTQTIVERQRDGIAETVRTIGDLAGGGSRKLLAEQLAAQLLDLGWARRRAMVIPGLRVLAELALERRKPLA